jgi:hypothetical protein
MCRRDKIHFINTWCLTFDPRRDPKHFPFTLYDFQREVVAFLDDRYKHREIGLIEKSRDMGVTWIACAWAIHEWLFGNGVSILFGSRKQDLVDDGKIDSIFGKLRYLLQSLPKFLAPRLPEQSKWNSHMSLVHPLNGNEIVGESMNVGFGRGGRKSIVFLDEFAHVQHSDSIWASVADNSNCIVALSTPNGKGNQFAWLKFDAKVPTLSLHWSKHPRKTREWYEQRKLEMQPWQVAQELDLSYERSAAGRIYQRFDRGYHVSKEVIRFNPEYEQFVTWDFGIADPTAILFGQVANPGIVQIWGCYELSNQDIDFFAPIAKGFAPKQIKLVDPLEQKKIYEVLRKVPQGHKADHYGDNAGVARTANSKRSCKDALLSHGIKLQTSGRQSFDWRIACTDNLLKLRHNKVRDEWFSTFEVSPDCERLIDCLHNYRWKHEEKVTDEDLKPRHDWSSHMVSALEFFAINRFPLKSHSVARSKQVR